jgi:toxin FitB
MLSETMRASPAPAVAAWIGSENPADLFTTTIAEAEILLGVAMLPEGRRKNELHEAAQRVIALFETRILPFDSMAAQSLAQMVTSRHRLGLPINDFDALIAAIAHSRGMSVATRNVWHIAA